MTGWKPLQFFFKQRECRRKIGRGIDQFYFKLTEFKMTEAHPSRESH